MHVPTLSQNSTRGMTKGRILSMQSPMPSFPPWTSRRRNLKIQRRRSTSSTPRCGKRAPRYSHYRKWEPKELHFDRGREVARLTNHITSTTIHHRVASPRTISSREPAVSPSIQHQALHGWGNVWCCSTWCLWCIIRTTILVEATCYVWIKAPCCYYYFRK